MKFWISMLFLWSTILVSNVMADPYTRAGWYTGGGFSGDFTAEVDPDRRVTGNATGTFQIGSHSYDLSGSLILDGTEEDEINGGEYEFYTLDLKEPRDTPQGFYIDVKINFIYIDGFIEFFSGFIYFVNPEGEIISTIPVDDLGTS